MNKFLVNVGPYRLFQPAASTPTPAPAPSSAPASTPASAGDLFSSIVALGETVRQLKAAKAPKDQVDKAVQQLLSLKVHQQPVYLTQKGHGCYTDGSFFSFRRPSLRRKQVWTTNLAWLLPPALRLQQLMGSTPARVPTLV